MAIRSSNQITFTEQKTIVEINEYYLATSLPEGVSTATEGWTKTPQVVTVDNQYLWNYEEIVYSLGDPEISEPIIIGVYTEGAPGKSMKDIVNHYATTQEPSLPDSIPDDFWKDKFGDIEPLSKTNKYLWNYETILYTDDTSFNTEPAIVGVYGDSGQDAVTFQIYSIDGFQFREDLTEIELKTVAATGDTLLSDVTYKWSYLDVLDEQDGTETWIDIDGATSANLIVLIDSVYAFKTIKCAVTYDSKDVLEDYITLTQETVVYSATVNFFNGNNVFQDGTECIVAYAALYRNGIEIDALATKNYYIGDVIISDDGTHLDAPNMGETDETIVYFIYKPNGSSVYQAVLGQYNVDLQVWEIQSNPYIYDYVNNLSSQHSKIVVIAKSQIHTTFMLDFKIQNIDAAEIAHASATIFDIGDPIIGSSAPSDSKVGQLWLDTSTQPSALKMWDGTRWVDAGYQNGGAIYTSKPQSYNAGDLWILASGETCVKYIINEDGEEVPDVEYGEGSILKTNTSSSRFDASHWNEAIPGDTTQRTIMRYYMNLDKDEGLIIGKRDKVTGANGKFYTLITDSRMGFWDNTHQAIEVVYISNQSATIKNARFYGDSDQDISVTLGNTATFHHSATFESTVSIKNPSSTSTNIGFTWQLETNGSLSLVPLLAE